MGFSYGVYTIYSDRGSPNAWARIVVKDSNGNTVDMRVINLGDSSDYGSYGFTVKVLSVDANLDGSVNRVYFAISPVGMFCSRSTTTITCTHTSTSCGTCTNGQQFCQDNCGVTSIINCGTTTTTTTICPTTPCQWGIQYYPGPGASDGLITKGSMIQIVYKPSSTQFLNVGEQVSSPNNYFDLGFLSFNTARFTLITSRPINGISLYNGSSIFLSNLNGLEVSSDSYATLGMDNIQSNKFYFLYDKIAGDNYPLAIGFYDTTNSRVQLYKVLNVKMGSPSNRLTISFSGTVSPYYIDYTPFVFGNPNSGISIGNINQNVTGGIIERYGQNTLWSTTSPPQLKLGDYAATSDANDIQAVTEHVTYDVGTSKNDVYDDSGVIVRSPSINGNSDQAVVSVPDTTLNARIFFGLYYGHDNSYFITSDVGLNNYLSSSFPNNGVIQHENLPTILKRDQFNWKGNTYSYHEQVDVSGVKMGHNYGQTMLGGMEKMEVLPGSIIYEYVFDQDVNFGGTLTNPLYSSPLVVNVMGKTFNIVGASNYGILVLQGTTGTITASNGLSNGVYTLYTGPGINGQYVSIVIKDNSGNTVDQRIINQGDSYDSTVTGLTIKILSVRALQDGTVIGTDVVFGPIGSVTHQYNTAADVTSVPTNDCFPDQRQHNANLNAHMPAAMQTIHFITTNHA